MKKQTLKSLALHKKTISNLEKLQSVQGGADSFWPESVKFCPIPPADPDPQPIPDSFFPNCSRLGNCPMI